MTSHKSPRCFTTDLQRWCTSAPNDNCCFECVLVLYKQIRGSNPRTRQALQPILQVWTPEPCLKSQVSKEKGQELSPSLLNANADGFATTYDASKESIQPYGRNRSFSDRWKDESAIRWPRSKYRALQSMRELSDVLKTQLLLNNSQ